MKQNRPVKKKKKERTWAEAITEVLRRNESKIMGLREIHEKIVFHKLKDIGMTKTDEKNLRTMLAQHTSTVTAAANCAFYRVKGQPGYYGLKDEAMIPKPNSTDSPVNTNEDSNDSGAASIKRKARNKASPTAVPDARNNDPKKKLAKLAPTSASTNVARRSNSYAGNAFRKAQLLSRRRTSSPNVMSSFSNLRNRPHLQSVHRSRSTNSLQKSISSSNVSNRKMPSIDLETPSSILTNTRLKSMINSATFSMVPASYQYQLIQLLPQVDRKLDENGVPRMTPTALNNEFFSQALQDWVTQLSEGEFTRETQARIMQEISKERSKISPWKEKFFEEYYGQKRELKRTRSRSHDMGGNLADLSFEAQLSKFKHLLTNEKLSKEKNEDGESSDIILISESESDHDPDFADTGQTLQRPPEKDSVKPINRRKISKPSKRTIFNSSADYPTNTAMIHRRGAVPTSSLFSCFPSNALSKFSSDPAIQSRSDFQVRDEAYRSDSEASDAELSDSNSFHQHDETDDDGESSDDMMNVGDNNLMDVDGDNSDSDDCDRPIAELFPSNQSYSNLAARRRSGEGKDRLGKDQKATVSVQQDISEGKEPKASESRTLVLRPHDNLGETVKALTKDDENIIESLKKAKTEPSTKESLKEGKTVVKSEKVGVVFGHGLQSTVSASYGDSIIPRISATSGLLSSPVKPTTVCTAATPARALKEENEPASCNRSIASVSSEKAAVKLNKANAKAQVAPPNNFVATTAPAFHSFNLKSNGSAKDTVAKVEKFENKKSDHSTYNNRLGILKDGIGTTTDKTVPPQIKKEESAATKSRATSSTVKTNSLSSSSATVAAAPKPLMTVTSKPSTAGVKRPQMTMTTSPVKRTKTLAEIKAQMKAKRLAVASASPGNNAQKISTMGAPQIPKHPVKIAQPIFCPTSDPVGNMPSLAKPDNKIVTNDKVTKTEKPLPVSDTAVKQSNASSEVPKITQNTSEKIQENKEDLVTVRKEPETSDQGAKSKEKIILKIKGGVVKNCSVKLELLESAKIDPKTPVTEDNDDDDDGEIIRKNRRLSQVIMSSGESSDDLDGIKDSSIGAVKLKENYSMLTQLALPASYASKSVGIDHPSLLKRPQKSPVFGEPAFEVMPTVPSKTVNQTSPTVPGQNSVTESKTQPFMTDGPVIGFQDIPSCSALSCSTAPTFVQPTSTISVSNESQKYRSTSKGKSLVQMQQLARTNRMHSDESDLQDSDTEDDSTASSAEEEKSTSNNQKDSISTSQLQRQSFPSENRPSMANNDNLPDNERPHGKKKLFEGSDCEDSCSTSSGDDKPVITECICACKRLVLCKGCGAYTHEECLSSKKLCSLCV